MEMKDTIKLKPTDDGFVEDDKGIEYIRYSLVSSMQKSVIDENQKLRKRLEKAREEIKLLKNKEKGNQK